MNKKTAYILMSAAFTSQIVGTALIYYFLMPEALMMALLCGFALTIIMHLPQLPQSMKVAKGKNLSTTRIVTKTVIFGASWWKPLSLGVIEK